jgi:glycerophosphoryl diester phosphodiesterase
MTEMPLIIGHRGASRDAPENTLAAMRLAWEQGADGIEADFRLSRDGRIVCMHDDSTLRTTGADLPVAASDLAALRRLDAGGWKGQDWAGERIPTLEDVVNAVPEGKLLFIELKSGPEIVPHLEGLLTASGLAAGQVVLLSFSAPLISLLKERLPGWRACWLSGFRRNWRTLAWQPSPEEIIATLRGCGADGLACSARGPLDEGLARALLGAGFEIHVWTVDSLVAARRFAALGARSIFTNRPGWMREGLSRAVEMEVRRPR